MVQVSFIIPIFEQLTVTQACLASLRPTLPRDLAYEIILVDDGSTDGVRDFLRTLSPPHIVLLNERNLGYAASNNRAARMARGEYLALLNNDLILQPGWFEPMYSAFRRHAQVGIVGNVQLAVHSGEVDHAGIIFHHGGYPVHYREPLSTLLRGPEYREFPAVTAACCMVAREWFLNAGGLDEGYRNGFEDVDLCLRARAEGRRNLVATHSVIRHHISRSSGRGAYEYRNADRFLDRWGVDTAMLEKEWIREDARAYAIAKAEEGMAVPTAGAQRRDAAPTRPHRVARDWLPRWAGPLSAGAWAAWAWLQRTMARFFGGAPKAESVPAPPNDPVLVGTIDQPGGLSSLLAADSVCGWVFAISGAPIARVRLRAGDKVFDGTYHLARPDVAAAYPDAAHARRSGFQIDYVLEVGFAGQVVFEAFTTDGFWRVFATAAVRIGTVTADGRGCNYTAWVRAYDTLTLGQIVKYRARIEALAPDRRPLVSVLFSTARVSAAGVARVVESVRGQIYPDWELLLVNPASARGPGQAAVDQYARLDSRIRVVDRPTDTRGTEALNAALACASGAFVAPICQDGAFSPHALAELALVVNENPQLVLIYSDEDKIDGAGGRFDPNFKSALNPGDTRAWQDFGQVCLMSAVWLRAIGGLRDVLGDDSNAGARLRFIEGVERLQLHHVNRVLFHGYAAP